MWTWGIQVKGWSLGWAQLFSSQNGILATLHATADTLLCHDDELEGRRIAFILYLVPPWDKADGGTLDLFSTDGRSPRSVSLYFFL